MIKELRKYNKIVKELVNIHKRIEEDTVTLYDDIIATLFQLSDEIWETLDEEYRNELPIVNSRTIKKCNPDDYDEIMKTILSNEKSGYYDIKYKYAYVNPHSNEETKTIINLESLKEHLEADGFTIQFGYNLEDPYDNVFDGLIVSTSYDELKEFRDTKQK